MADYAVNIEKGSYIACATNQAYNIGIGDLTVTALVQTQNGGTVVSRKTSAAGPDCGGWLLVIKPNGVIKFATDDGYGFYEINTNFTNILDGLWHHIAVVRQSGELSLYVDCMLVPSTISTDRFTPLNVDSSTRLLIGNTDQKQEPYRQFVGVVEDVTLWNRAISMQEMVLTMCNSIKGNESGLIGYWPMDQSLNDLSANHNDGQGIGTISFVQIFRCDCCYGNNSYCFVSISNDGGVKGLTLTRSQQFNIKSGTPALMASVVTRVDDFTFPAGVLVSIQDPNGHIYSQDQNDNQAFVQTQNGSVRMFAILNPAPGTWQINSSAPSGSVFNVLLQTVPTTDIPASVQNTLEPIYGPGPSGSGAKSAWSGWGWVGLAAATVALGLLTVATMGATTPVLIGVLAVVTVTDSAIVAAAAQQMPTHEPGGYYTDAGSNAGQFSTLQNIIVTGDARSDSTTDKLYESRVEYYGYLITQKFKRVGLTKSKFVTKNVNDELQKPGVRYFTCSAHGQNTYLVGNDLKDVLRVGSYPAQAAKGKAFHMLACKTGASLGKDLVANGATAFFGYNDSFKLITSAGYKDAFLDCDAVVDYKLTEGKTAGEAQDAALAQFDKQIMAFENNGDHNDAVVLAEDREYFVGPNNAGYGDPNARIV